MLPGFFSDIGFFEGIWFRDFVLLLLPDTGKMCLVFWVSEWGWLWLFS